MEYFFIHDHFVTGITKEPNPNQAWTRNKAILYILNKENKGKIEYSDNNLHHNGINEKKESYVICGTFIKDKNNNNIKKLEENKNENKFMEQGIEKNYFLESYFIDIDTEKEKEKKRNYHKYNYHNNMEVTNEQNEDKTLYIFCKKIIKENEDQNRYHNNNNKNDEIKMEIV